MKRVQLVVTGRCERDALHRSLQPLFADIEFVTPVMVNSFTSTPLIDPPPFGVLANLDKFAAKLVEKIDEDPETLVVGVDDLEIDQSPKRAADEVRAAVLRVLDGPMFASGEQRRQRLAVKVVERCSFHLLAPMLEAYFFGEPEALQRAGAVRPSRFDATAHDVEDFVVDDPAFLELTAVDDVSSWRRRHPKLYLQFLVEGPRSAYRETHEGVAALRGLAWRQVLKPESFAQLARALIADVSEFLEVPNPTPGVEHPLTARSTHRRPRVLRNL